MGSGPTGGTLALNCWIDFQRKFDGKWTGTSATVPAGAEPENVSVLCFPASGWGPGINYGRSNPISTVSDD